jgi:ferredoxin-NADP reductase
MGESISHRSIDVLPRSGLVAAPIPKAPKTDGKGNLFHFRAQSLEETDLDQIDVLLASITFAARDINLYEFRRLDAELLPAATPGSHIDLHLPNGLVRQYSLASIDDERRSYVVAIKHERNGRGGSRYVHDELRIGQTLAIGSPRNNFRLIDTAAPVVLIAGGIGITPIWCMIASLEKDKRPWQLVYACRSRLDAPFLADLEPFNERVKLHLDDENGGQFLDIAAVVAASPPDAHLYCCGPLPMLSAFEAATRQWPADRIHVEYFAPKSQGACDRDFEVQLARSHRTLAVPRGKSILEVLRSAGVEVVSACEEGVCGACETRVLSGIPDHRDAILNETERASNKSMMICCSGCKSERLVLDI